MNTKLDISQIEISKLKERSSNFNLDYRISISKEAYQLIHEHAIENTNIELCGILIGEVFKDKNGPYLEISNSIRGEFAKNEGTQVTFTHETWSYIHKIKDKKFPNKQIVGWYHTHPLFGIFLSSPDVFIHENFFNQPWHTAFVVDPVSNDEGFFIWKDGKPFRAEMFWMGGKIKFTPEILGKTDKEKKPIKVKKDSGERDNSKTKLLPIYGFVINFLFVILLLISLITINDKSEKILSQLQSFQDNNSQVQELNKLEDNIIDIEKIKSSIISNPSLANIEIRVVQMNNHILCYGLVSTNYQKDLIGKIVASTEGIKSIDTQNVIVSHFYMTKPNDNLSKIAANLYGNSAIWIYIFNKNKDILEDPNMLLPSTKLILPEVFK